MLRAGGAARRFGSLAAMVIALSTHQETSDMKRLIATAAFACALQMTGAGLASAQDQYLGEVRLFAITFCPIDWMQASGQTLQISQYAPLYSLYGTTYGGDGRTTFGLPNLNGRAPYGSGTGGQPLGTVYGNSIATLTVNNLPAHTHTFNGTANPPVGPNPAGALSATFTGAADKIYSASGSPANVAMGNAIGVTGGNQPISIQSPALAMMWCVAINGLYPTRP
jgi:microcystin-dependent protein